MRNAPPHKDNLLIYNDDLSLFNLNENLEYRKILSC